MNSYKDILKKLNHYDHILQTHSRDSEAFIKAEDQSDKLIFGKMHPKYYGQIVKNRHKTLNNIDIAKIIYERQHNIPIERVIDKLS